MTDQSRSMRVIQCTVLQLFSGQNTPINIVTYLTDICVHCMEGHNMCRSKSITNKDNLCENS